MTPELLQTVGTIIVALLGGGIVKALVDYVKDRRTGRLEQSAFEYKTLSEMNDRLRSELKELRQEIEEERAKRRKLEDDLATERRRTAALESRVAELEASR